MSSKLESSKKNYNATMTTTTEKASSLADQQSHNQTLDLLLHIEQISDELQDQVPTNVPTFYVSIHNEWTSASFSLSLHRRQCIKGK